MFGSDFNGLRVPDVCFSDRGPHYVYVIGDWGGLLGPDGPQPAPQRTGASFVTGVDDCAQKRVADQMAWRAKHRAPDYFLNVGDNFYWQGLAEMQCGAPSNQIIPSSEFDITYEKMYTGPGIDGKPWLSVLGNHDYGGYIFNRAWDQQIAYSWKPGGRWVMPGQYWRTTVRYTGFEVDYWFVDSNEVEAREPHADPAHNICSLEHIGTDDEGAGCGEEGPKDVWDCPSWFTRLWEEQKPWLEDGLEGSTATWQIIVTHFPPVWKRDYWVPLAEKYGIDLIVTGHMHQQELHHMEPSNFLRPTAWIVSGGGGGITSEGQPDREGYDDQYGFFELTLAKDVIEIQGLSHGGIQRYLAFLRPRPRGPPPTPSGKSEHKKEHGKSDHTGHGEKQGSPKKDHSAEGNTSHSKGHAKSPGKSHGQSHDQDHSAEGHAKNPGQSHDQDAEARKRVERAEAALSQEKTKWFNGEGIEAAKKELQAARKAPPESAKDHSAEHDADDSKGHAKNHDQEHSALAGDSLRDSIAQELLESLKQ